MQRKIRKLIATLLAIVLFAGSAPLSGLVGIDLEKIVSTKASALGDFAGSKLGMDEGETAISMIPVKEYKGYIVFFFENGKVAKVDISAYETKTKRKKLIKAYSDKSPLVAAVYITEDCDMVIENKNSKYLLFNTGAIASKTTKDTQGVAVMNIKKGNKVTAVYNYTEGKFAKSSRYKTKTLPANGTALAPEDEGVDFTAQAETTTE